MCDYSLRGWRALAMLCAISSCQVDLSSIPVTKRNDASAADGGKDANGPDSGPVDPCATGARGTSCDSDDAHVCIDGLCVLSICGDGFVDTRTGEKCEGNGNATTGCVDCKTCTGTQCDTVKMSLCPNGQMKKAEICNGLDDDCDGKIDEDVVKELYVDHDHDGYGRVDMPVAGCALKSGLASRAGDCNDSDPNVHPGAKDACNGLDDDCDGNVDKGCPCTSADRVTCGARDGSGHVLTEGLCQPGRELCENGVFGVCMGAIMPANEICDGKKDEDCDGSVDEGLRKDCWPDADHDGYAVAGAAAISACVTVCPKGQTETEPVAKSADCDDTNKGQNPGVTETCNGVDDDCDGKVDETLLTTYFQDNDHDGYGNTTASQAACDAPTGYVTKSGDCRDDDAQINPKATEVCDGIDNDCNGSADDGISCNCKNGDTLPCPPVATGGFQMRGACKQGLQTCSSGTYGACVGATLPSVEVCDGTVDEDCDGSVDEMLGRACWVDGDHDSFAASGAAMTMACNSCPTSTTGTQPTGSAIDCNDSDAAIYPGRREICNGKDDDCVNGIDDTFNLGMVCGIGACAGGMSECATTTSTRCSSMPGGSASAASSEICDGNDNDCNTKIDDGTALTSCAAMGHTCYQGTCAGCAAGSFQCSGSTTSQKCDGTGAWNNNATCSPSASSSPTICDPNPGSGTYGTCIANPPYDLGNDNGTGRSALGLANNTLLAQPILVTHNAVLLGLGMVTTSGSVGGAAYFGVYADSFNATTNEHQPGTMINRTAAVFLAAGSTNLTGPNFTTASAVDLSANTTYWVVANIQQASSENVQIYNGSGSDPAGPCRVGSRTFATLSNLASGATSKSAGDLSLFVELQNY